MKTGLPATESAGSARTASGGAPERRRNESGRSHANFVVGGVATMMLFGVVALVLPMLGSRDVASLPPQTTDPNWDVVGTIMFPPSGAFCRQFAIDNNTGSISETGFVRCIDVERVRAAASQDSVVGPLEGIRRSFAVSRQ